MLDFIPQLLQQRMTTAGKYGSSLFIVTCVMVVVYIIYYRLRWQLPYTIASSLTVSIFFMQDFHLKTHFVVLTFQPRK